MFLPVSEVPLVFVAFNFQPAVALEYAIVEISLILQSVLNLLQMSLAVVLTVHEISPVSAAVSILDLSCSIEFVV
jgi:hypothetical protein